MFKSNWESKWSSAIKIEKLPKYSWDVNQFSSQMLGEIQEHCFNELVLWLLFIYSFQTKTAKMCIGVENAIKKTQTNSMLSYFMFAIQRNGKTAAAWHCKSFHSCRFKAKPF